MSNLILRSNEVIFNMINYGPAMMEINKLENEVKKLTYNNFNEEDHIYEEGEVIRKEGFSPYVYHSDEYLRKQKLGTLTEEEKRQAKERTEAYWKRFNEDKGKQWE